jgi:hypothetical protein
LNIIRPITSLRATALKRGPGYLDYCIKVAKVTGSGDATLCEFTPEQFADIRKRFPGLGDKVHAVAGVIGAATAWPCMKGDGTTDLKPGSPCDRAKNFLNGG